MDYRTPASQSDAMPPPVPSEAGSPAHRLLQVVHQYPETTFKIIVLMVLGYFVGSAVGSVITELVFGP